MFSRHKLVDAVAIAAITKALVFEPWGALTLVALGVGAAVVLTRGALYGREEHQIRD